MQNKQQKGPGNQTEPLQNTHKEKSPITVQRQPKE